MPLARSPSRTKPETGKQHSTRSQSRARSQTEETEEQPTVSTRHTTPVPGSFFPLPTPHIDPATAYADPDLTDTTITDNVTQRRRDILSHREMSPDRFDMDQNDASIVRLRELANNHINVHKFVADIEKLKGDGSNIARWKLRTARAIYDMTNVSDYWDSPEVDENNQIEMAIDRCAGRVIDSSVDEDLRDLLVVCRLSHHALRLLEEMFQQGGRTSQYTIFESIMLRQFDPSSTELVSFINTVNKDFEKLKSSGFVWTEDAVKGMVYQLRAPVSGEYGMDTLNATLDARYRNDKSPFTSAEVRAAFQSLITTRKTVQENEQQIQVLSASIQRMNVSKNHRNNLTQPSRTTVSSSQYNRPTNRLHGPIPPAAVFPTTTERDCTVANPVSPKRQAVEEVQKGIWQCFHCAKFGHGKASCGALARGSGRTAPHFNDWVKCTNGVFYTRQAVFGSATYGAPVTVCQAQPTLMRTSSPPAQVSAAAVAWSAKSNTSDTVPTEYMLDGGASHHVSDDLKSLVDYQPINPSIPLKTAAHGDNAFIVGRGSLPVTTSDGSQVLLQDFYYSPSAPGTLISQAALVEAGAKLWFWGNDVVIRLGDGKSIVALYKNRKWLMNAMKPAKCRETLPASVGRMSALSADKEEDIAYLWHRRFGHVDMKRIRKLCHGQLGLGLPKSLPNTSFVCEDCLICKSTRDRKLGRSERTLGLLDVIVSDVMGPFPADFNGNRFTVTFRDVATTFSDIVIIKNKSDVPDAFTNTINKWERETGFQVKHVRTDGGGEYMKTTFGNWLRAKGIVHEHSNPYEPEQNGVAERLNRTISDMGRTMLAA